MRKKKKQQKSMNMAHRFFAYFVCMFALIALVLVLIYRMAGEQYNSFISAIAENAFSIGDLLATQISVSFIVVSLVTVFSQRNDLVYWEDSVKYKLERPIMTNFSALSAYLFADLFFSILLVVLKNDYVYCTFFISVLLLFFMSYRIISAFFMHDLIKKQLERDYKKVKSQRQINRKSRDLFREYKRKTIQNTIIAIEGNDIEIVCENLCFLYRFDEKDDADYLVKYMLDSNRLYMLIRAVKTSRLIFDRKEYILYYMDICRRLIDSSPDNSRFARSIVRSMGERIICDTEDNEEEREQFRKEMKSFVDYCNNNGNTELASDIISNYEKQVARIYA